MKKQVKQSEKNEFKILKFWQLKLLDILQTFNWYNSFLMFYFYAWK